MANQVVISRSVTIYLGRSFLEAANKLSQISEDVVILCFDNADTYPSDMILNTVRKTLINVFSNKNVYVLNGNVSTIMALVGANELGECNYRQAKAGSKISIDKSDDSECRRLYRWLTRKRYQGVKVAVVRASVA